MKRRKFIQAALVAVPAVGAAQTRLYGVPESVVPRATASSFDRLLLPISRSGLPPEFWRDIQSVSAAVIRVVDSNEAAVRFHADPVRYMQDHGLDTSDRVMANESFRLLTSLADPTTKDCIRKKDYDSLFVRLKQDGVLNGFHSTNLTKRIESAINARRKEIRAMMERRLPDPSARREVLLSVLGDDAGLLSDEDIAIAWELLSLDIGVSPTAILVVAIAAVLITVVAEVMVFTVIAAWVSVHGPDQASALPMRLAMLDSHLAKDMEQVRRISELSGDGDILVRGTQEMVVAEMTSIVDAMKNSGLLSISPQQSERIIEVMSTYAFKTAGL